MSNYKEFPEVLATLIFLPAGIFMGHMMSYLQTTDYAVNIASDGKFWPFIVGGVVAILTGGTHLAIKHKYKQYKFEHMYFQMVGLIILLITGILLMSEELLIASFLGFVGHGIIYVSALSYINIRAGKSKHRYLKLSMPHFLYLIGVGVGSTLVWVANDYIFYYNIFGNEYWLQYTYDSLSTGMVILISCCVLLGGFLINEVLQKSMRSYNYKESLDNDINRENKSKEIFKNKYFHITPAHLNFAENAQLPHIPLNTEPSGLKECGFILYALGSKVLTLMFFYYPFIFLHTVASTADFDWNIFTIMWFGVGGIVISLVLIAVINFKINFLLSITVKIIFMIVMIIFFSYDLVYFYDLKILFWFVYMGLGFGFSHPDINILSYTNLISNEIVLAIGYFIEHLIIGVIQYETTFNRENIFDLTSTNLNVIFAHALTFILILVGVLLLGIFVIPNGKHNSLLEIKNILNNCANINQLVNTGNYDGQQNPQLYWQQQMYLQQNYPQIAQIPPQVPPAPYDPNNSAYRPPYSQNMFNYGQQPIYQQPQQQQFQFPPQPQYQQTPYLNTTYPSQMNNQPGSYNKPNLPPNYSQHENQTSIPAGAMMPPQQQNFQNQNLPPNLAPITDNSYTPPSQYDQNIARPIIPPTNMK